MSGRFAPHFNTRNRDPRAACVLLLDVSESMQGAPIRELQEGFRQFTVAIDGDPLARKRTEIAVITFDTDAQVLVPFTEGRDLEPVSLSASGTTNMAAGIELALDEIERRKDEYKAQGVEYYRPWIFLLTDGAPNPGPHFEQAVYDLGLAQQSKRVVVFAVGVGPRVDFDTLRRVSVERSPLRLSGLNFGAMFQWLSNSMGVVSSSNAFEASDGSAAPPIQLPPPEWGVIA
jgi:uncharacterized protein YegL